jgi:uncharacterized protein (DUF1778 family)
MPTPRAEAARTRFSIRLSPDERAQLAKAAAEHRMPLGEFVRDVAVSAAADYLDDDPHDGRRRPTRPRS